MPLEGPSGMEFRSSVFFWRDDMNDDQFPGSALDGGAEERNEGAEAAAEARQREPAASDGEFVLGSLNSVSGQTAPLR